MGLVIATTIVSFFILVLFMPIKCHTKLVVDKNRVIFNFDFLLDVIVLPVEINIKNKYVKLSARVKTKLNKNYLKKRGKIPNLKYALSNFRLKKIDVKILAKNNNNLIFSNILSAVSIMINIINENTKNAKISIKSYFSNLDLCGIFFDVKLNFNLLVIIDIILKILLSNKVSDEYN